VSGCANFVEDVLRPRILIIFAASGPSTPVTGKGHRETQSNQKTARSSTFKNGPQSAQSKIEHNLLMHTIMTNSSFQDLDSPWLKEAFRIAKPSLELPSSATFQSKVREECYQDARSSERHWRAWMG
jgi:hypothetical protein